MERARVTGYYWLLLVIIPLLLFAYTRQLEVLATAVQRD